MRRFTALGLVPLALACASGTYSVRVTFESAADGVRAREIEVALLEDGCDRRTDGAPALDPVQRIAIRRGSLVALLPVPAGRYGLYAIARDAQCAVIASGCTEVDLLAGGAGTLEVELRSIAGATCGESRCVDGSCTPGQSLDGGSVRDAGSTARDDATVADATTVGDATTLADATTITDAWAIDATAIVDATPRIDARTVDGGAATGDAGSEPPGPALRGPHFACYTFDTLGGRTATDISGEGRHATCAAGRCPSPVAGHLGGALSFDGVDDVLSVPHDASFESTGPAFTVSAWVAPAAAPAGFATIAGIPNAASARNAWEVFLSSTEVCGGVGAVTVACAPVGPLLDGDFHHVALVWDGTAFSLYVDGGVRATAPFGPLGFDDESDFTMGADVNFGMLTSHFAGVMDDVCIYARALTSAEITTLAAM